MYIITRVLGIRALCMMLSTRLPRRLRRSTESILAHPYHPTDIVIIDTEITDRSSCPRRMGVKCHIAMLISKDGRWSPSDFANMCSRCRVGGSSGRKGQR